MSKGGPTGFPCPQAQQMTDCVQKAVGEEIKSVGGTH